MNDSKHEVVPFTQWLWQNIMMRFSCNSKIEIRVWWFSMKSSRVKNYASHRGKFVSAKRKIALEIWKTFQLGENIPK
jgi:hypothetical protein